ncbi:MAG: 30S ribosomal protein S17 [Planctomycetia bacterium]|nr:30S ribosomal protein S17 [Planctomycetia bacterium]NCG12385.1 30S ribosomal protein S17 [Planctomycetia bacterium]
MSNETNESGTTKKPARTTIGLVVSSAMEKTIVIKVERLVQHRKYRKFIRKHTKFYAHDEGQEAVVGDLVEIEQIRPLSKLKRWNLKRIVRMAPRDNAISPQETAREIEEAQA